MAIIEPQSKELTLSDMVRKVSATAEELSTALHQAITIASATPSPDNRPSEARPTQGNKIRALRDQLAMTDKVLEDCILYLQNEVGLPL